MPYIKKHVRKELGKVLNPLLEEVDSTAEPGVLNYVITKICLSRLFACGYLEKCVDANYADYNEVIGVLECVKFEIQRRKIAKYEDKKIKENGDVY